MAPPAVLGEETSMYVSILGTGGSRKDGRPSTELFAPSSSVHQQMQPERSGWSWTNSTSEPKFLAQPTLYTGQPIAVSSQIQAGFQPSRPMPDFITGPANAPAQPFHTAGANYSQVPFHPHNVPPMPQGMMVQLTPATPLSPWTTGFFDCMDDPLNAVVACCLPCVTFGQIAEIVDRGSTSCGTSGLLYGGIQFLIGCPCLLSCTYRTKLRHRFNLIESPAPDWISHFFCECCALSQEYRELKNRGLDPSIGWQGNVATMQQNVQYQVAMVPPMHQQPMTMRA
ncbi:uncharacterized protein J3R85_007710 [Psidium guajava]|nr:uncharacterized protein J3R85_007710 [Psidium guajava]